MTNEIVHYTVDEEVMCGARQGSSNGPAERREVTCRGCLSSMDWLLQSGRPLPRKVSTLTEATAAPEHPSIDDRRRGRSAMPSQLQICLDCGDLRGPSRFWDEVCACDRAAWGESEVPRAGDLGSDARLCAGCLMTVVSGSTRWTLHFCRRYCLAAVGDLNRRAQRLVVPIGVHSLVNGVALPLDEHLTPLRVTAFYDQLSTLFDNQQRLHMLRERRTIERARQLGFTGGAVSVTDYLAASFDHGLYPTAELQAFIELLVEQPDREQP
jgi:hypothetical protein